MKNFFKKLLTMLAPVLGAGAIGVCPLCWIGSASLLTYLGLGALIPAWRWIAFGFRGIGAVLIVTAVAYNKSFFRKPKVQTE